MSSKTIAQVFKWKELNDKKGTMFYRKDIGTDKGDFTSEILMFKDENERFYLLAEKLTRRD